MKFFKLSIFIVVNLLIINSYAEDLDLTHLNQEVKEEDIINISDVLFQKPVINPDIVNGENYYSRLVQTNSIEKLKFIISPNNVNHIIFDNNTILHISGIRNYEPMLELALQNKANIYAINSLGELPIHLISENNNISALNKILTNVPPKKIDSYINTLTKNKRNLLHYAFLKNKIDVNFIELLIQLGVNVNQTDQDGNTPAHLAALNKHNEGLNILLKNGADFNIKNNNNLNAIEMGLVLVTIDEYQYLQKKYTQYLK